MLCIIRGRCHSISSLYYFHIPHSSIVIVREHLQLWSLDISVAGTAYQTGQHFSFLRSQPCPLGEG